jgi:uncharacterized membrane protein
MYNKKDQVYTYYKDRMDDFIEHFNENNPRGKTEI